MVRGFKPGDVVAMVSSIGRVSLVEVARGNSKRCISYLVPGRVKPIAAQGAEFVTIEKYPAAARRLYDCGKREFADEGEARRAVLAEAELEDI